MDQAIGFDPLYALAYNNRGVAWRDKKEYVKAINDFDAAIRQDPKDPDAYFNRSVILMIQRQDGAVAGFKTVLDLQGGKGDLSTYAVILSDFAARLARNHAAATAILENAPAKLKVDAWPYPIVKLLRGEIDESALLAAAIDDDKRTDARCFLGLNELLKGHNDQAVAHFRWVRDHGNHLSVEYVIARAELDRVEKPAENPRPGEK